MLIVSDLRKEYQVRRGQEVEALDGVSLTLPDRGMVFILGKSGSGKSTLLNILGGLDSADSGDVIAFGRSIVHFTPPDFNSYRNKYIGFVFQDYNVLNMLSVRRNVEIAIELQGRVPDPEEIDDILDRVGLLELADRMPSQLSGGQKQRIAIARALVKKPRIILADEPTGALDTINSQEIFKLLKEMSKTCLVVSVTHDAISAERYADRIIKLKEGRVIGDVTRIPPERMESLSPSGNIKLAGTGLIRISDVDAVTESDLSALKAAVGENSSAYVSYGDDVHVPPELVAVTSEEETPVGFADTTQEDIDRFCDQPTEYRSFRAKLRTKTELHIALTNLKHAKVRLALTAIISILAFTILGVSTSMTLYDVADSFAQTSSIYTPSTITFYRKSYFTDPDGSRIEMRGFTDFDMDTDEYPSDATIISEAFDGNIIRNYGGSYLNISRDLVDANALDDHGSLSTTLDYIAVLPNGYSASDIEDAFGFSVVGELPTGEYDVMVTDYMLEVFKASGGLVTYQIADETESDEGDSSDLEGETEVGDNEESSVEVADDQGEDGEETADGEESSDTEETAGGEESTDGTDPSDDETADGDETTGDDEEVTVVLSTEVASVISADDIEEDPSCVIGSQIYLNDHTRKDSVNEEYDNRGLFTITGILYTGFDLDDADYAYSQTSTMTAELTRERLMLDYLDYGPTASVYMSETAVKSTEVILELDYENTEGTFEDNNRIKDIIVPAGSYSGLYKAYTFSRRYFTGSTYDGTTSAHYRAYVINSVITSSFITDSFRSNIGNISNMCLWLAIGMAVVSVLITMNYIFTSVSFRKQDIGILKGLGARSSDVFSIFLFEALFIGIFNFVVSSVLTAVLVTVVNSFLQSALATPLSLISVSWVEILILLMVSLFIAVISAIIPSYRIASMKPVKAMKRDG